MRTKGLAALALLALIAGPVLALPRSTDDAPLAFVPVPDVGASVDGGTADPDGVVPLPSVRLAPVQHPTRPIVHVPEPPLIVVVRPTPESDPRGARVAGVASWYCGHGSPCTRGYPGGLYAAAGPALRVGDWRGRLVRVEAAGVSVQVRLIDCNCGRNANLIDLYSDAFERLGPLSRGVLKVTVTW